jgi:ubiquinone/menaquinone biosynthesis C-methylase UbiE
MIANRLLQATYEAEQRHFWFRGLRCFSEPLIDRALAGIDRPLILDCGCGTGANMRRLSTRGRTVGFDITRAGMGYARKYGQARLAQASIIGIPFADKTFDFVTAFDVLSCLETTDVVSALKEAYRVLKPGRCLLLNTAAVGLLSGRHAVFGQEVHRATKRALRQALETAGFVVERLTYTNFTLFPIIAAVRTTQRWMGLSSPEESGIDIVVPPKPVNDVLTQVLALESRVLRRFDMPIGSSLLALASKPGS